MSVGVCWWRKAVAGAWLVVTGAELVAAGAGKCSLVQNGSCWCLLVQKSGRWFRSDSRWCRTGGCWYLPVQESGRWCQLVQESDRWCRKPFAGAGWLLLVQKGGRWCRSGSYRCSAVVAGARRELLVPSQSQTDSTRFDNAAYIFTLCQYAMWSLLDDFTYYYYIIVRNFILIRPFVFKYCLFRLLVEDCP